MPGINEDRIAATILLPGLAVFLATGQMMVLSFYVPGSRWWLVACFAGWGLSLLIAVLLARALPTISVGPSGQLVSFLIVGGLAGFAQWFVLRHRLVGVEWWLAASLVGWGLLGLLIGRAFTSPWQLVLIGTAPGAITGIALAIGIQRSRAIRPKAAAAV